MLNKIQFSLLFILMTVTVLFDAERLSAQGRVLHMTPAEVNIGTPILISAMVENPPAPISSVKLLYRVRGDASFKELDMVETAGMWEGTIPEGDVTESGVEYLIIVSMENAGQLAFPEVSPYEQPAFLSTLKKMEVAKAAAETVGAETGSEMFILSPEMGSRISADEVLVALSLFYAENLDLSSVALYFDGRDVTGQTIVTDDLVTYTPQKVQPGLHTIILESSDVYGTPLRPVQWEFTAVEAGVALESKFKIRGRGYVESRSDKIRGEKDDVSRGRASIKGSYDFVNFQALVDVTSKEDKLLQPKNRFLAGFNMGPLTVSIGDVNPTMTPLTLWGKRVRGGEGNLELGFINVHVIKGDIAREVTADIDPATGEVSRGGTLRRSVLAIRPSFGPKRAWQWGFNFMHARDDSLITTNLPDRGAGLSPGRPARFSYTTTSGDQVDIDLGKTPVDNIVLGSDMLMAFDNQRFVLKGEVAFSLMARDITGGPFTKLGLDTLIDTDQGFGYLEDEPYTDTNGNGVFDPGIDTFTDANNNGIRDRKDPPDGKIETIDIPIDPADLERYFILNQSIIPLDPTGLTSLAYEAGLKFNYLRQHITANYKYLGDDFNSLANPFIRKDIKGFNVSDRLRLFQNKVIFLGRFELLENNLEGYKETTTTTTSIDGNIMLYPGRGLPRISLNIRDYIRDNGVDTLTQTFDSSGVMISERDIREQNATITSTFTIGYDFPALGYDHKVNLNLVTSERADEFKSTRGSDYVSSELTSNLVSLSMITEYDFPLKTQLLFTTNSNRSAASTEKFTFNVLSLGGEYLLLNKKLAVNGALRYSSTTGAVEFNESRVQLGGRYRITDNQNVLAGLELANRKETADGVAESFTDTIIRVKYMVSF